MTFESEGLLNIVAIYIWLPPASYIVFPTTLVGIVTMLAGINKEGGVLLIHSLLTQINVCSLNLKVDTDLVIDNTVKCSLF